MNRVLRNRTGCQSVVVLIQNQNNTNISYLYRYVLYVQVCFCNMLIVCTWQDI